MNGSNWSDYEKYLVSKIYNLQGVALKYNIYEDWTLTKASGTNESVPEGNPYFLDWARRALTSLTKNTV